MDRPDADLVDLFTADPRVGVLEASRRLGVARGTVQEVADKAVAAVRRCAGPARDRVASASVASR